MKTLLGHLSGQGAPNLGHVNPHFLRTMEHGPQSMARSNKSPPPFLPLRQPLGGHGNVRKEHPVRPA